MTQLPHVLKRIRLNLPAPGSFLRLRAEWLRGRRSARCGGPRRDAHFCGRLRWTRDV